MSKLFLFMMVSVDGFFEGLNHEIDWHNVDAEFNEFAIKQTSEVGTLLFGRKTYELMQSYWPSEQATKNDPVVAGLMNNTPKIVFSKTLQKADWNNTTLIKQATPEQITKLKTTSQKDLALFGSNNLTVHLMQMGLVDEFRIMVNPVALGKGHTLFTGLQEKLNLKLVEKKYFHSGNVLLCYQPKS